MGIDRSTVKLNIKQIKASVERKERGRSKISACWKVLKQAKSSSLEHPIGSVLKGTNQQHPEFTTFVPFLFLFISHFQINGKHISNKQKTHIEAES